MKNVTEIKKVAILGCGFIGFSFAIVFSRSGIEVNMYNRKSKSLDNVKEKIKEQFKFLEQEKILDNKLIEESMTRIKTFDNLEEALQDVDYVQEALPENLELKQNIFKQVADLTDKDVVISSSCSGLKRSDIVSKTTNFPERCLVAHPTNPPHLIPFMEISGDDASEEAKKLTLNFMKRVGQKPIICREIYGYVLNRLQLALVQEAFYLVKEEVCTVEGVERALTDGLGLRWAFTGPYGVEELNSINLREGLYKYKDYMLECFDNLGKIEYYDDTFIDKSVEGFNQVMKNMNHDEYLTWRNKMVLRTRKLKGEFN